MLDSLTEEHGLTPHQRDEMTKILERRRKAVGEFFRLMFGPGREGEEVDRAAIRAKIEDVQTETTTALQNLLSPSQYEAFEAQDPGSRMGGMGGFGPPRGAGRVR